MDRLLLTTRARNLCSMYVRNLSPQHNGSYKAHTSTRATPTLAYFPPFLHIISLLISDEDLLHRVHHLRPSLTLFSLHLHCIQRNYSTMPLSLSLSLSLFQFNSTSYSHRTNVSYVLELQKPDRQAEKVMIKCYMHGFQCFCFWFACKEKPASPYRCSCMHVCTEAVQHTA